ncbi:CRISPR system Cms protein Csm2 [Mycobacterium heckeshornense]|uniref:type III-A CRISPR-associated protein Csm2 n=1 Tax=Mycobacterium heckeshornense TaxID=110505 RepID=UPI001940A7B2|nr:type III-A CRISPR-associated protein Csm2 [Mycobacterium heckeshornense]BCQ10567.1 CRISPR system Cms protein Csm2 [Mycobacterium heckeshornense]
MSVIEDDYVTQAERVISGLPRKYRSDDFELTTTQLRVLLSLTAQLLGEAQLSTEPTLSDSLRDKVQYLRVRFIYQSGRDKAVKDFVHKAKLLDALEEIGDSRKNLLRFCRYMEALVAYKKYLDPKEATR